MKKRSIMFIVVLLCITSLCFAKEFRKEIKIQGGYDSVAAVSVTPIASQAESYKIGMPFAIDDPSVQQGIYDRGRLIANWSILANFPMLLDIEAEVMHHSSDKRQGLGYVIVFVYDLSYIKNGMISKIPGSFVLEVPAGSGDVVTMSDIDLLQGQSIQKDSLVGSADGEVYFTFDLNTTQNIIGNTDEFAKLPNGNYLATIKLKMKAAN